MQRKSFYWPAGGKQNKTKQKIKSNKNTHKTPNYRYYTNCKLTSAKTFTRCIGKRGSRLQKNTLQSGGVASSEEASPFQPLGNPAWQRQGAPAARRASRLLLPGTAGRAGLSARCGAERSGAASGRAVTAQSSFSPPSLPPLSPFSLGLSMPSKRLVSRFVIFPFFCPNKQQPKWKLKQNKTKTPKNTQLKSAPDIQSCFFFFPLFFCMQNAHNFFFFFFLKYLFNTNQTVQPACWNVTLLYVLFSFPVRFEVADIYKPTTIKENKRAKTNEQNCTSSKNLG